MFIDTHAHIYLDDFKEDLEDVIQRSLQDKVDKIYMPNIDSTTIEDMWRVHHLFPHCIPMIGLHPCHVKENYMQELKIVERELSERPYCAIGEVGIDLYWDKTFVKEQEKAFDYQIAMAREASLPVIIHSRDSLDVTIDFIQKNQNGHLRGIFHCFNGTEDQARRIMNTGFYMGIGGVVTYKNAGVDKVVAQLPLEYMVLETDAPYLSPVPYRGKRNESSYILKVADKLSELHHISLEEVARVTTLNAQKIFGGKV
jgi:TatD DNase family protein